MPVRPLSKELQDKAQKELNEDSDYIEDYLRIIREWPAKQPHLSIRTDDQWLLSFLRGCKFSLERTKQKLETFYTVKSMVPEFFADRDPFQPKMQEILSLGFCLPLPRALESTSPRVLLLRNDSVNPEKLHVLDMIKITLMTLDILLNEDDNFVISGHIVLQDFKGISLSHMLQMSPSLSRKMVVCLQDVYPTRPKAFYYVNTPSFFETLFNLVKPFMSEKLKNRINIYNGSKFDQLSKDIPSSILPSEYGGSAGSIKELTANWKNKVESYRDWFLEDVSYCSNEAMRQGKPKTSADLFGMEGSFRKLQID